MMLNLGKNVSYIFNIVCVLGICFLIFNNKQNSRAIQRQETIISELTDELKSSRTKEGKQVFEKSAAIAERDQIKAAYTKDLARIKKEFNIKEKNLLAVIKAKSESHYLGEVAKVDTIFVAGRDSTEKVAALTASDSTKWLQIKVTLSPHTFVYGVHTNDSITYAFGYEKRKVQGKLFKQKTLLINGKNENPYSTVTGLTSFVIVDERPDILTIGPSVQAYLAEGEVKYSVGVSLQVPVIKIKRPWK